MRRGADIRVLGTIAGVSILALTVGLVHRGISVIAGPDQPWTTATAKPPPGEPVAGRAYLNGVYAGPPDNSTPRLNGAPWDYTINNSYQDDCRGCSVSGLTSLDGYPVIIDLYHVQSSYPDFTAAAKGAYENNYQHTVQELVPYAMQLYAVRIDSEFNGSWSAASAFKNRSAVDPATWIAGFRNLVLAVREALPEAKIIWNPALGQQNPFPYYPGDDVVDLIGPDVYCQPAYSSSSAACWDEVLHGGRGSNLDALATFAGVHHKPMVIPEWGDAFGDGVMIQHMREWMDQHNVVAQSYWDSGDDLSRTAALSVLTVNQRAYVEAFGHRPYTGSYWPRIIPVPADASPR